MVTFSILVILTMGIAASTVTSVQLSVKGARVNNAYYAAEAAVQKGLQQIKDSIAQNYKKLMDNFDNPNFDYPTEFGKFFTYVKKDAKDSFKDPYFSDAITTTTFYEPTPTGENTADFKVTSTATMTDGSKKTVIGSMTVQKYDVVLPGTSGGGGSLPNNLLTVCNNIEFANNSATQQITAHNGTIQFGGYPVKNANKKLILRDDDGKPPQLPDTFATPAGSSINYTNTLTYDKMLLKRSTNLTRTVSQQLPLTGADRGSKTDLHYLEGAPGYSFVFQNGDYYGQVYSHGDVTIVNGNYYGNIFCDGNVTIGNNIGGKVVGNIVTRGNINLTQGNVEGTIQNGKMVSGVCFAGGDINFQDTKYGGTCTPKDVILYAAGNFYINENPSVNSTIIFSENNINFNASNNITVRGAMYALKNLHFDNNTYYHDIIADTITDAVKTHDWYSTMFGSSTPPTKKEISTPELDAMITNEKIVAE